MEFGDRYGDQSPTWDLSDLEESPAPPSDDSLVSMVDSAPPPVVYRIVTPEMYVSLQLEELAARLAAPAAPLAALVRRALAEGPADRCTPLYIAAAALTSELRGEGLFPPFARWAGAVAASLAPLGRAELVGAARRVELAAQGCAQLDSLRFEVQALVDIALLQRAEAPEFLAASALLELLG